MQKKWLLYLILKISLFLIVSFASIYNLIYFYDRFNEGPTGWKYFLVSFFLFPWEVLWLTFKRTSFIEKIRTLPEFFSEFTKRVLEKLKREWRKITWFETDFINRAVKVTISLAIYLIITFILYAYRFSETSFWAWYTRHIVIIFLGIVAIRQSFRYLFPSAIKYFEANTATFLWKKFINRPNSIRLFSFIMMAAVLVSALTFVLQPEKQLIYKNDESGGIITSTIRVSDLELHPQKRLIADFELIERPHKYSPGYYSWSGYETDIDEYIEAEGVPPILTENTILINGRKPTINEPTESLPIISKATLQIELVLNGSDFYFPFDQYYGIIHIKNQDKDFGKEYKSTLDPDTTYILISEFDNRSYEVRLSENYTNWDNIVIYAGYSRYYQLLVVIIGLVLIAFLILIFRTNQKEQLIELSVGVFATIITLRGFLIPQELDHSPLFLDQALLFYIVLFLIAILYKYGEKNN